MNQTDLLRHIPTGDVYVFQPELAKRKDMEPIVPDAPVQLSFDFGAGALVDGKPEDVTPEAEQPEAAPATADDVERTLQLISEMPVELPAAPVAPAETTEVVPAEEQPRPVARKRARNAA